MKAISDLRVKDQPAAPFKHLQLGMTRTFQIVKPFPELSVLENVMIGAFNKTASTAKARKLLTVFWNWLNMPNMPNTRPVHFLLPGESA